jgi:hypothetical protein
VGGGFRGGMLGGGGEGGRWMVWRGVRALMLRAAGGRVVAGVAIAGIVLMALRVARGCVERRAVGGPGGRPC